MTTAAPVTLNTASTIGDKIAAQVDTTGNKHQQVQMEYATGGDPVLVSAGTPMPVLDSSLLAVLDLLGFDGSGNLKVAVESGGGTGGTASNFGVAFPGVGTAMGASDGTNMVALHTDGSGNLNVNISAGALAAITDNSSAFTAGTTQAAPIALAYNDSAGAVTSGNMGIPRITSTRQIRVVVDPTVSGGLIPFELIAPSTPTKSVVKASPGQIYLVAATNEMATPAYIKFFDNVTGSVTLGTTAADFQLEIPANTAGAGFNIAIPQGIRFQTGLVMAVTGGISETDNTGITASKVHVLLGTF